MINSNDIFDYVKNLEIQIEQLKDYRYQVNTLKIAISNLELDKEIENEIKNIEKEIPF